MDWSRISCLSKRTPLDSFLGIFLADLSREWAQIHLLRSFAAYLRVFLSFLQGICGFFFLGILGPGFGPGGISQDLIPTAVLISILFKGDTSTPNMCKSFLPVLGIRFLLFKFFRYWTNPFKTIIEYKAFPLNCIPILGGFRLLMSRS